MTPWQRQLTELLQSACVAEVSLSKPGNVDLHSSFSDATVSDFLDSAAAIAPVLSRTNEFGLGRAVLESVRATRQVVTHNTNLGIILLLAPLSAVPENATLCDGIEDVLSRLDVDDAVQTYRAISEAMPGGLGKADQQDVSERPTEDLRTCMKLAADRDLIARQYANGFQDVLSFSVSTLLESRTWQQHRPLCLAWLSVRLLAQFGDSLIVRKCGEAIDQHVRKLAQNVVDSGWPHQTDSQHHYDQLDAFLRDSDHKRNPGTTADMVAATVFACFRDHDCMWNNSSGLIDFKREPDV